MTPEPSRRLASAARWLWRAQGLGMTVAALIAAGVLSEQAGGAVWMLLPVVVAIVAIGVVPELRWARWRYEVREEEIDLRHGTVRITRTLVPMLRVQHVDTTRGVVEQSLDLATVVVHTAAGSHSIPLLSVAAAAEVRDRIADLTREQDEL
jgi:uncharacterized protein